MKIVIVGGGYAAIFFTTFAERKGIAVTIIERNECFFHKIGGAKACIVQGFEKKVVMPYDRLFTNVHSEIIFGEATEIDVANNCVKVKMNESQTQKNVPYDFVIVATGVRHGYGQLPDEAMSKQEMLDFFVAQQNLVKTAEKFDVVGGGSLGVETSAQLKCNFPERETNLYHSRDRLISSCEPPLSIEFNELLQQKLAKIGVRVHLNTRFQSSNVGPKNLVVDTKGTSTPMTAKTFLPLECYNQDTYEILVTPTFQVQNAPPNVFAMGDIAYVAQEYKQSRFAYFHAQSVLRNIQLLINGKQQVKLEQYVPNNMPFSWVMYIMSKLFCFARNNVDSGALVILWLGNRGGIGQAYHVLLSDWLLNLSLKDDKGTTFISKIMNRKR